MGAMTICRLKRSPAARKRSTWTGTITRSACVHSTPISKCSRYSSWRVIRKGSAGPSLTSEVLRPQQRALTLRFRWFAIFRISLFANRIVPADHPGVTDYVDAFTKQICEVIVGKNQAVKLAVACLLARGHLLIEDIPGVGKTTLSQALARSLALAFQRIQFTSDLLPADILGNSIFDRGEQRFVFHRGPLFSQVVLIDEVNRATAKTQSALLEAMEEHHISIDGVTYELPEPFFVIATQNPQHQVGTFPLPESQLDRFLMRIELGVPDRASERAMLLGMD